MAPQVPLIYRTTLDTPLAEGREREGKFVGEDVGIILLIDGEKECGSSKEDGI